MALTTNERSDGMRDLAGLLFQDQNATATFDTATIQAAFNAADDWMEANASSYNSALPAAFRTVATPAQKALLLASLAMRRAGKSARK